MSNLFMREANIAVAGMILDAPPLTVKFKVDFNDEPEPNLSEIEVYNLTDSTIAKMVKGSLIVLNAGYKGNVGTIMTGVVDRVETRKEGVDKITKIFAGDASDVWQKAVISKTFKAGTKASQVIRGIIGEFGLEIGEVRLASDITYHSGKTVYGSLQEQLRQIVADTGSKMHITNGVIMIRPPEAGTIIGFLLNSDTGLLGTPGVIQDDKADYQVECLLNHRLTTDSLIQIKSRTANGNFRVVRGSHTGSLSGDWKTILEVVAI